MRSRKLYIYLAVYLLLGTAAVVSVQGQPPAGPANIAEPSQVDTLDVVVPRGKPKAISDWALAGVVWSDACLLRKLALETADAAEDRAVEAKFLTLAGEAEQLISSLEDFGWRRISRKPDRGSGDTTRRAKVIPPVPASPKPRQVGGATLVPSDEPVELDIDQRNFRLEGAGDAEPEILPPQVEKGFEEAIANKGLRSVEFGEEAGRISYRESQTQSDSMPYSFESIYDTDDYDPDVDFQTDNPLVIADPNPDRTVERLSPEEADDSDDNVADMYGFEDPVEADGEDLEFSNGEVKPANLLDRLSGTNSVDRYTSNSGRYKEDSDWVQMHLDMNQMLWNRVEGSPRVLRATQLAQLKLANSAAVASTATSSSRLKRILATVSE